jgi:hypothetical protein
MRVLKSTLLTMAVLAWGFFAFSPRDGTSAGPPLLEPTAAVATMVRAELVHTSDALAIPTDLEVVGEHLVLVDRYADESIHVLREDGTLVRSFGRQGDGPGEYRQLTSISRDPRSANAFWAYDMAPARLTYIDLEDEESLERPWEARLFQLHSNARVTGIEWTADGKLIASGFFPDGRLGLFASDGEMLGSLGPLPDNPDGVPGTVLQHAYMGTLKQHPNGSRLAIGLRHASTIEIRDSGGNLIATTERPQDDFAPKFETQETDRGPKMKSGADLRFGYIDIAVTGDRIYGLFSGRTREGYPGTANFGNFVHVFDWNGKLLRVLEFEDQDLIAIAIDDIRGTLYGVIHEPSPAVVALSIGSDVQLARR